MKYLRILLFTVLMSMIPYAFAQPVPCFKDSIAIYRNGVWVCVPPINPLSVIKIPPGIKQLLHEQHDDLENGISALQKGDQKTAMRYFSKAFELNNEITRQLELESPEQK